MRVFALLFSVLASAAASATSYAPIELDKLMSMSDVIVSARLTGVSVNQQQREARFRIDEVVRGGIGEDFTVDLTGVEIQTMPTSPAIRYLLFFGAHLQQQLHPRITSRRRSSHTLHGDRS